MSKSKEQIEKEAEKTRAKYERLDKYGEWCKGALKKFPIIVGLIAGAVELCSRFKSNNNKA